MFKKVGIPLLGVVENMSIHVCSNCGHEEAIFGSGGGDKLAQDYGIEVIGKLPLDVTIREQSDSGTPVIASDQSHPAARAYLHLAENVERKIQEIESTVAAGPTITISND
jgi:ATP-binding protein involved in chromosome partitioning